MPLRTKVVQPVTQNMHGTRRRRSILRFIFIPRRLVWRTTTLSLILNSLIRVSRRGKRKNLKMHGSCSGTPFGNDFKATKPATSKKNATDLKPQWRHRNSALAASINRILQQSEARPTGAGYKSAERIPPRPVLCSARESLIFSTAHKCSVPPQWRAWLCAASHFFLWNSFYTISDTFSLSSQSSFHISLSAILRETSN